MQPLREKRKIDAMKKVMSDNKRDLLMFVLGINCGLRISDILLMKVEDVLDSKGKPKSYYELREKKTNKFKRFVFAENVQKAISEYLKGYSGRADRPLFASRKTNKGESKALSRQKLITSSMTQQDMLA
ncbi:tyrosine-type recombinase/integrase [Paenibacillus sp. LjRoot56]|uniref:tyrosine-type recombinase/integrase n=1 Tax=Paenibacillus sp. LjRoot56 TaxID=3342333 RepID=UPI003F4F8E75